jgi:RHS repeat-associated protein
VGGDSGTRQYVYDETSVLQELDPTGALLARYEWGGDRLLSLNGIEGSTLQRRFYSFDGLGSVTNLSDDAGVARASYHLDAWGNFRFPAQLSPPGDPHSGRNRFAFTGYLWDQESELYHAKARFYDPEFGRFTSQDSFLGEINDPPTVHRYFYGHANPTTYIDPDGHAVIDAESLHTNEILSRVREYNPSDGKIYRESICGGDRICIQPQKPDSRVQAILKESGGDKAKAYQRILEMKAAGQRSAAAITIEESDFDVHGNLDASKVYGQFLGQVGGHSAELEDLREAFVASIAGARAGEVRDISFLYNVAHEYSAVRAYQLADEDSRSHFGPDFIQRNAHLMGGAGPRDVRIEAGAALAMDTISAASLGLGIYRAGASLVREAAAAPSKGLGQHGVNLLDPKAVRPNIQGALDDLAAYRSSRGLPPAGSADDVYTAARLDVRGRSFYGRNADDIAVNIRVNAQTRTHAEASVFQQAKNAQVSGRTGTLYVDRPLCSSCGDYGGLGSLMRGAGVDRLYVVTPKGRFLVTASRPSRPIRLGPN